MTDSEFEEWLEGFACPHHFEISRARAQDLLWRARKAEEKVRVLEAEVRKCEGCEIANPGGEEV